MHVVYSNQHYKHATHLALPGYDEDYLEIPERAEAILDCSRFGTTGAGRFCRRFWPGANLSRARCCVRRLLAAGL